MVQTLVPPRCPGLAERGYHFGDRMSILALCFHRGSCHLVLPFNLPQLPVASLPPQNAFARAGMGIGGKMECPIHALYAFHTVFREEYNLGERAPTHIHSFSCSLNDHLSSHSSSWTHYSSHTALSDGTYCPSIMATNGFRHGESVPECPRAIHLRAARLALLHVLWCK